ncbi:NUDIX domain-containing protein [Chelatococcus sp. SYSU_G07232]|uniref:NUDIX domain-containing protein n=1 Tax=Chelatococcus albus TaxID=3047466 RepID=A0ABT7ACA1_9HYPH|nr:NUDIX domain-containing protein [Chelatococcus sp. SYSU_G07232]MDJ1157002.1 NUDIX domain-containing protein [Chelatococcus sp. SYSU_G07232]
MPATSAGIMLYRRRSDGLFLLLVHPGGPFWRNKDAGAWSIPKGECGAGEAPEAAARREFAEEVGQVPAGRLTPLGGVVQSGGKRVVAFALEGDLDVSAVRSNTFTLEWPPGSGRMCAFPEIDRAAWFPLAEAREKIIVAQRPLIDRLETLSRG